MTFNLNMLMSRALENKSHQAHYKRQLNKYKPKFQLMQIFILKSQMKQRIHGLRLFVFFNKQGYIYIYIY